ncbi:MAG: methyltransferase domain-containing protein [SAR324 cluster bacterium]|nr:methyltransferase domain-containing protein [SAR324 cluster bacterium]
MQDQVKEYYGKVLQSTKDLKTDACCTTDNLPAYIKNILSEIHEEVLMQYYGCGLVAPPLLEGMRVLDLGCGAGRDCYILSKLVGESGYVVGVDMTPEQLATAEKHIEYHTQKYGYSSPNVEFKLGYIEHLDELNLEDNRFDIIVSNCVINLSPDKEAVFREAYRVLKPGGELYFSDVYSDRRIPTELLNNPTLYGECLSGALYWNDFLRLAKQTGFLDPRLVENHSLSLDNDEVKNLIGHIGFMSATYRLFKLPKLETACEDYGQSVIYQGSIPQNEHVFQLDNHHIIEKGKAFPVCGNTYRMLHQTRFRPHFEFSGNWGTHFGLFDGCGIPSQFEASGKSATIGGSCC